MGVYQDTLTMKMLRNLCAIQKHLYVRQEPKKQLSGAYSKSHERCCRKRRP